MASCKYTPALLKHRLVLQSITRTEDGQGGFTEEWGDVATVWAQLTPVKAYERFQAMQLASPTTYRVLIRYRRGITAADRFLYGARVFEIKEVINVDERNAWMQLVCIEREQLGESGGAYFLHQDGYRFLFQDGDDFIYQDGKETAPRHFLFQDGAHFLFQDNDKYRIG